MPKINTPWKICLWDSLSHSYLQRFDVSPKTDFKEMYLYTMEGKSYIAVRVYLSGLYREAYLIDCESLLTYSRGEIPPISEHVH